MSQLTSKADRDMAVRLLKRVKSTLAMDAENTGRGVIRRFICIELHLASDSIPNSEDVRRALCRLIVKRLDGNTVLETWLCERGYLKQDEYKFEGETAEKIMATRHAWVDSLIEEFAS
jgi:hypothetical protein